MAVPMSNIIEPSWRIFDNFIQWFYQNICIKWKITSFYFFNSFLKLTFLSLSNNHKGPKACLSAFERVSGCHWTHYASHIGKTKTRNIYCFRYENKLEGLFYSCCDVILKFLDADICLLRTAVFRNAIVDNLIWNTKQCNKNVSPF